LGSVTILRETTRRPIELIGERAGICWGADITNSEKNYKRGLDCIKANHGRALEFVNIEMVIDGYSARVIREWYTHLGGTPTRLQASTRYIDYNDFDYIVPVKIENYYSKDGQKLAEYIYKDCMEYIKSSCKKLEELNIPREDIGMLLPLGMTTKIVDKRNLRNLVDMSRQRMCTRAYWEYRKLFGEILYELSNYSEQWAELIDNLELFKPKCEHLGYCPETYSCGKMPKQDA